MGIEEVKKEIVNNAKSEARKIINEAENEREAIMGSVSSHVAKIKERLEKEAEAAIEHHKIMALAEADSFVKKQRLGKEKEILDEVFSNARKSLESLSPKKREQHIKTLLSKAEKHFKYSKVYCAKEDLKFSKKSLPADILGGVVLENEEGDLRLDLSYETLLSDSAKECMADLSKMLFN